MKRSLKFALLILSGFLCHTHPALAAEAAKIDSGSTAWMMISTALVMLMTFPGLALFYAGLVRKHSMLSIMMQCFGAAAVVTVSWVVLGYSMAFTPGNGLFGGFSKFMLHGITKDSIADGTNVPETVYLMFQLSFAIITPALVCGAFSDRMKFSAVLLFFVFWPLVVYAPIAHQVWGGGFLMKDGVLDYAGGTVVHINAGMAGLIAGMLLGPRPGYVPDGDNPQYAPYNLALCLIGIGMLWFGWFGFNAGSALAADGRAGMAMLTTQVAAAVSALVWMKIEWVLKGKPSVTGFGCGVVAGLVGITPAAGFVDITGAIAIGALCALFCYYGSHAIRNWLRYDDSLDLVGVHGVGGVVGAILTGVFALTEIGGTKGALQGNVEQVWIQAKSVLFTMAWCGIMTFVLLKVIDLLIGLRVPRAVEESGVDEFFHGEKLQ